MEIKTLVTKAHENAVKHGFWEPPLPFGTAIALIHSELSEALEEERNGNPDIWFACNESDNFICTPQDETECLMYGKESLCKYRSRKPEGVAVELADAGDPDRGPLRTPGNRPGRSNRNQNGLQ